jgi:cytochrome oxidase Cu insertion factor (SCO1/SenC/PrrC family)
MRRWTWGAILAGLILASLRAEPVPDLMVTTDSGLQVHFVSELIAGKTAFINFIYTDCGGMCPMQGRNFAVLSRALSARLTKDLVLISISIAPEVDTPQRLARWKSRYDPAPGWTCVTGEPAEVRRLLHALIGDISPQSGHTATAVVFHAADGQGSGLAATGSARSDSAKLERFDSLAGPEEFMRRLKPATGS